MEHLVLWPLPKISTLVWLSLEGNPLSYHPKHRILAIKYLHPSLSNGKVFSCDERISRIIEYGSVDADMAL